MWFESNKNCYLNEVKCARIFRERDRYREREEKKGRYGKRGRVRESERMRWLGR